MQGICFRDWVRVRSQEAPAADHLAMLIAGAGTAGISRDDLARALSLDPDTLQDLLGALVATGQVEMLRVNGRLTYRAVG